MLELKGITKDYPAGSGTVHALKGIDLRFRKSEFVSILGPSGCGKTTMLNIIGGLDGYTEGDLIINGTSTKEYKDRDWDTYRNHSIGFVFQSYNLIPHQTVLSNVELALTLSGVSKHERRERAKKALEQVGLGDQLTKRPAEMSGGQMQRVAIARALVNNPDIILADEPTGALDTETSVQVMEILKEISDERLIIMVTHNPELAEKYSSRIIRMLDGVITDDSNPLSDSETAEENKRIEVILGEKSAAKKKVKKPSMSFGTSFMLSLRNLFTKKGRTLLTSFAGSIGIIGIALILAISQGMTAYINTVQEETLSAYPLTLQAQTVELSSLMEAFMSVTAEDESHELDAVYKKATLVKMLNAMADLKQTKNDLNSFNKDFVKKVNDPSNSLHEAVNGIKYSYPISLNIYTKNEIDNTVIKSDLTEVLTKLLTNYAPEGAAGMMSSMSAMQSMSPMGNMASSMSASLWEELLPGLDGAPVNDLITDQYELVAGDWPKNKEDIILVVDKNNEIDDITLYALGLIEEEHMAELADSATNKKKLENDTRTWSFEEIMAHDYRVIFNSDCYTKDTNGNWIDLRTNKAELANLYDNAMKLKVTGIIRPREDATANMLSGNICYTKALTEYVIEKSAESPVVKAQKESPAVDILTNSMFKNPEMTNEEKKIALKAYLASLSEEEKQALLASENVIVTPEEVAAKVEAATKESILADFGRLAEIAKENPELAAMLGQMSAQGGMSMQDMDLETLKAVYSGAYGGINVAEIIIEVEKKAENDATVIDYFAMTDGKAENGEFTEDEYAQFFAKLVPVSDSTYENNLNMMGAIDLDHPSSINIYASSFENKDIITDAIADYNKGKNDLAQIKYTDYVGIMMSSVTTIIDAITYVLIAFVAISLIVSSIMIGVITLISVQERTKEIGILRAIGASKKNVASMFNAETVIIGFSSGLLGVVVTYLLCIPINLILHHLTGLGNLNAILPVPAAIILILISMLLTLISGIIPSRSASKKDPVVALRTE